MSTNTNKNSVCLPCLWLNQQNVDIQIPTFEEIESVIMYKIQISVGQIKWFVEHRYNDFHELHNQLIMDHGVFKDILPQKKIIGNRCLTFLENRRKGLESYLQCIYIYLKKTMPRIFIEFLNFQYYDVIYLLKAKALQFFLEGDIVLSSTKSYTFTPVEIHAISQCTKMPFPAIEENDKRYDITHVLDLCSQLHHLKIIGSNNNYLNSNIIPNSLSMDFTSFKSLQTLEVNNIEFDHVTSLGSLRDYLSTLIVCDTSTINVYQILQCDVLHKTNIADTQAWKSLTTMDLSNNNLVDVDNTIKLLPQLKALTLNSNKLQSISDLSSLIYLTHLGLSNNLIKNCDQLHTKLGNILYINLSQNKITSLKGFEKLYSLESVDISSNCISDIEEISFISNLPCIEYIVLTGNPVATTVDYRIKIYEQFGTRAKEICLDNEKPTQSEIDKISILQALRIVKEGKTINFNSMNSSF